MPLPPSSRSTLHLLLSMIPSHAIILLALSFSLPFQNLQAANAKSMHVKTRHQVPAQKSPTGWKTIEEDQTWKPSQTALIICDMWDDHWCKSAASRVAEMAPRMNEVVKSAREQGILIIHAPSSVTSFYASTPQRQRALQTPFHKTKSPLSTSERWGTTWCWHDAKVEGPMPIDDSDMGCSCSTPCTIREAWKRQISTLEIAPQDFITDHGQETFNILAEHKIKNVLIMGVHLNMCVLGRPFGIRQLVQQGKKVVLVRDLTDTMYNPKKSPYVDHFTGTDLVIQHVEQRWCPTTTSPNIAGGIPFKFKEDHR